ncbi:site-specific DNA-methyltransferase [Solwaraspora sp. WMMD1047]|uniref:DNA-methyltransferase n=1 Tax=Solwaraspora sp. WMMD1047 TaxID=3016102 RepID=UPI002417BDFE|nr:site-specific DNA-methyltransferase [Solwaraspora sp. WMMD1047]MDG4829942.1 site-specific DNA-methyltransferase [Solwaraspora sp. WMMD1047]
MTSPPLTPTPEPAPWWRAGPVSLHVGDAHEVLAALPDASVDCIVTSPPYWGLRSYDTGRWNGGRADCGHDAAPSRAGPHQPRTCPACEAVWTDGQYGQEPTIGEYVDRLVAVFDQARRVLHPHGTVWLNLGDSYAGTGPRTARPHGTRSVIGGNYNHRQWTPGAVAGLPAKNLIGIPWRVALALQANKWILRNAAVWAKTNGQPSSARDRLTTTYEMVFLLTRSPRYYFDLDAIRIPLKNPHDRRLRTSTGSRPGPGGHRARDTDPTRPRGKNPGDVWPYPTRALKEAHFAAYPIEIPLRCIAAGCRPEGVVLDPFSGAATTGLAALHLGRSYIGVDLSSQYAAIAKRRLLSHWPDLEDPPRQDGPCR